MAEMPSIDDVIVALCDTITNATGLRCGPLADTVNPPCVQVFPDGSIGDGDTYYEAMKRGVCTIPFIAQILIGSTALRTDMKKLHDAISPDTPTSIPRAIYEDPTLGTSSTQSTADATMTAYCAGVTEYGLTSEEPGKPRYLTAKVRIPVKLTRGAA